MKKVIRTLTVFLWLVLVLVKVDVAAATETYYQDVDLWLESWGSTSLSLDYPLPSDTDETEGCLVRINTIGVPSGAVVYIQLNNEIVSIGNLEPSPTVYVTTELEADAGFCVPGQNNLSLRMVTSSYPGDWDVHISWFEIQYQTWDEFQVYLPIMLRNFQQP